MNEQEFGTRLENQLIVTGDLDPTSAQTHLVLASGAVLNIPTEILLSFGVPASPNSSMSEERLTSVPEQLIIPIIEERLQVGKRVIERERIRLHKEVEERTDSMDVALTQVGWDIQRIAVDRVVEKVPELRFEGETTIYPIMEEKLIVAKQLILKEEIHVTRTTAVTNQNVTAVLRRERLVEERETLTNQDGQATLELVK